MENRELNGGLGMRDLFKITTDKAIVQSGIEVSLRAERNTPCLLEGGLTAGVSRKGP